MWNPHTAKFQPPGFCDLEPKQDDPETRRKIALAHAEGRAHGLAEATGEPHHVAIVGGEICVVKGEAVPA